MKSGVSEGQPHHAMNKEHTGTLREWFLEQLLKEQLPTGLQESGLIDGLKDSLRKLAGDYAVVIQMARHAGPRLAGRPLSLLISPRGAARATFLLRLSGVLAVTPKSGGSLHFSPLTVEVRSGGGHGEDHSQELVDHLRRVLEVLKPGRSDEPALSA